MKEMTLNEYQKKAMGTCMPSSENFAYMILNLYAEMGEFSGKCAKAIRKEKADVQDNELRFGFNVKEELLENDDYMQEMTKRNLMMAHNECEELKKEAGDIMWQIAGLCHVMGWELEHICEMNLEKLASRQERGVIDGDGDNR